MHSYNDNTLGAAFGGTVGIIKSLTMISMISWAAVFDTAILTCVGAVVGFLVTGLLKWIKKKIF